MTIKLLDWLEMVFICKIPGVNGLTKCSVLSQTIERKEGETYSSQERSELSNKGVSSLSLQLEFLFLWEEVLFGVVNVVPGLNFWSSL